MDLQTLKDLIAFKTSIKAELDKQQGIYEALVCKVSIDAYSTPLFPDKKNPEILLCASNDDQRQLAVQHAISFESELVPLAVQLSDTKRLYNAICDELEATQLIIKYETAKLTAK